MKQTYLFKLYQHSPLAAVVFGLFILSYAVFFYKKMDMLVFPYNSMYSIDFFNTPKAESFAIIVNNYPVKYTHFPYWKKDLLETSLSKHAQFIKHNKRVFLHEYLPQKFSNKKFAEFLVRRLTPSETCSADWVKWYLQTAGVRSEVNSKITLRQYSWTVTQKEIVLTDSVDVYQFPEFK